MSDAGDNTTTSSSSSSSNRLPPMPTMAPPPLPPPSPHRSVISQLSSTSTTTSSAKDLTHLIAISTEEEEENHNHQDDDNKNDDNNEDTILEDDIGKKKRKTKKSTNCFQFGRSRSGTSSTRATTTNLLNFCPTRLIQIGSKQNTLEEYNLTDYDYNDVDNDADDDGNNYDDNNNEFVTRVQQVVAEATVSVQGVLDEHVQPTIEQIRRQSVETLQDVQQHSSRSWAAVHTTTQQHVETLHGEAAQLVARSTTQLHHSSQQFHVASTNIMETTTTLVQTQRVEFTTWFRRCRHAATVTYRPYYAGTAPGYASLATTEAAVSSTLFHGVEGTFRAYGTVVFCNNPITGLFIWCGILVAAPRAGFASILGVLTVNVTALYLHLDPDKVRQGQWGRNAVLIGPTILDGIGLQFSPATLSTLQYQHHPVWPLVIFFTIVLSLATLVFESVWNQYHVIRGPRRWCLPSLLLPYNMTVLVSLFCAKVWNTTMLTQIEFLNHYSDEAVPSTKTVFLNDDTTQFVWYRAILNGIARIFLVDGMVTGLLMVLGVLCCSRILAVSLVCGAGLASGGLGYGIFHERYAVLNAGYASVNPALVVAGLFFYCVPSYQLCGVAGLGMIVTVILSGAVDVIFRILGLPVSTSSLGFCIVLLSVLSMDLESMFGPDHFLRRIPEAELSTPEGYLDSLRPPPSSTTPTLANRLDVLVTQGMLLVESPTTGEADIEDGQQDDAVDANCDTTDEMGVGKPNTIPEGNENENNGITIENRDGKEGIGEVVDLKIDDDIESIPPTIPTTTSTTLNESTPLLSSSRLSPEAKTTRRRETSPPPHPFFNFRF